MKESLKPSFRFISLFVLFFFCLPAYGQFQRTDTDWLDLSNGAVVLSVTSEYDQLIWSALGLIDGTLKSGWATEEYAISGNSILIELARHVAIKKFVIDNRRVEGDLPGVRSFRLSGSNESPQSGFKLMLEGEALGDGRKEFTVNTGMPVRWLKLEPLSNSGDDRFIEIMELEAYGDLVGPEPNRKPVLGVYDTKQNLLRLDQKGGEVAGCYDRNSGTFAGSTDGRVIRFEWREKEPARVGQAVMVLNSAGDRLNGLWYWRGELQGTWLGNRVTDGRQPECKIKHGDLIRDALESSGRTTLYGIRFDPNSHILRKDSGGVLSELLGVLNKYMDWEIVVEGYTDAQASDEYNKKLSRRRAEAVRRWLVDQNISVKRISIIGLGEGRPVADNETPQGRSLNRRVEIRLKGR